LTPFKKNRQFQPRMDELRPSFSAECPGIPEPLAPTRSRGSHQNHSKSAKWTDEEDALLRQLKATDPSMKWADLYHNFPEKTKHQVKDHWDKVLNPERVKGSWTGEEDLFIVNWVNEHGTKDWGELAANLPGRISKQCRERWHNHLSPSVLKADWSPEEDGILIECQEKFGNRWSHMTAFLPGRTDNAIKNRWNSSIKRRLDRARNGLDTSARRGRRPKRPSDAPVAVEDPRRDSEKAAVSVDAKPPITTEMAIGEMSPLQIRSALEQGPLSDVFSTSPFSPTFGAFWSPLLGGLPSNPWAGGVSPTNASRPITKADLSSIPGPKFDDSLLGPKE
jgi:hypothetical protein